MKKAICKGCGDELELCVDNFYTAKTKSGFTGKCRKCVDLKKSEWVKNNGKSVEISRNKWKNANKDKIKHEYIRDKEKIKKRSSGRYENRKNKILQDRKDKYAKNRTKFIEKAKKHKKSKAKYSTYKEQLFADEAREAKGYILEVKCKHCKKWFSPLNRSVQDRLRAINGKSSGENHFYCSHECKDSCEVYGKKHHGLRSKMN